MLLQIAGSVLLFLLGFLAAEYRFRRERVDRYSGQLYEAKLRAVGEITRALGKASSVGFANLFDLHQAILSNFFLFPAPISSKMLALLVFNCFASMEEAIQVTRPMFLLLREHLALPTLETDFLKAIVKPDKTQAD